MRDEAHVGLVDSHAEGDGRDHDDVILALEGREALGALLRGQTCVIKERVHAFFHEEVADVLAGLARKAVDDAAFAGVVLGDEARELVLRVRTALLVDDPVEDVRAVEARHEAFGVEQEPFDDLLARLLVRRGGERDPRHLGEALPQD